MKNVTLYTKDYCPYCKAAKSLLTAKGVSFRNIEITDNEALRVEMIDKSNGGTTVPQIFIGGQHIGGATDLIYLEENGLLDKLLKKKDVA